MTVINPNSISGITSITLPSGDGNVLTIHTNDGTERFRIDSSGNVKVGTAATISPDGDLFVTGVCTATTLAGSGANLTSLPSAQLTGALPAISGANLTGIAATDNVRTGILDVAGIATFRSDVNLPNINGGQIGGRRNLIINGAMTVSQRGTSFSAIAHNAYGIDRFKFTNNTSAAYTLSQSSTSPDGFANSLKLDCTTADTSISASEYNRMVYVFEGQDLQGLAKGTSSAKKSVLSFYVKTNKTGTYSIFIYDDDNSRQFNSTYTVSDTNWNRYTIEIPADTTGAIANDNGGSLEVYWHLIAGSSRTSGSLDTTWNSYTTSKEAAGQNVNLGDSTSNEWYLTGVQLEIGSTATGFEHRSNGEELSLCQRYYVSYPAGYIGGGRGGSGGSILLYNYYLPTPLRGSPTLEPSSAWSSSNGIRAYKYNGQSDSTNTPTLGSGGYIANSTFVYIQMDGHSIDDDRVASFTHNNTLALNAEL